MKDRPRIAWELERASDGTPLRMWYRGVIPPEPPHVRYDLGYIVTNTGHLPLRDARAVLWEIACAERRHGLYDAISAGRAPETMDALVCVGWIEAAPKPGRTTSECGFYRLTDLGRRELP